jgi:hypothetical protein
MDTKSKDTERRNVMSNSETKNKPVQEIRMGLIKAAVWANQTKSNGIMHNVTLSRVYRDTNGDWQETHSLGRNDLLLAAKVLDAAHTFICGVEQKREAPAEEAETTQN